MTKDQAYEFLDLEQGASTQEVRHAYKEVYNELQIRLTNAPTEQQKQLYRKRLAEVEEAYLLLGGETEDDLSELPSIAPVEITEEKPLSQEPNLPLNPEAAMKLLTLSHPFTTQQLNVAYQCKKTEFEEAMNTAPSETLKRAYIQSLDEINQAFDILNPLAASQKVAEKVPLSVAKNDSPKAENPEKPRKLSFWLVSIGIIIIIVLFLWQPWHTSETPTDANISENDTISNTGQIENPKPTQDSKGMELTSYKKLSVVNTTNAKNIDESSADVGGNITDAGGGRVSERGVVYGTSRNPTLNNNKVSSGSGTGSFTVNIDGLHENTTYYIRAYATNENGTAYGDEKSFKTSEGTPTGKATADYGSFSDPRDGKTYKTLKIGNQTWLAENLNYNTANSWCYGNSNSNCKKYGRLYDWQTAKIVCPSGWSLPSKSDFEILLSNVGGGRSNAYHALKDGGNSGFSALFGGWSNSTRDFNYIGYEGHWWSNSEDDTYGAWRLIISSGGEHAYIYGSYKTNGFSVRCIQK